MDDVSDLEKEKGKKLTDLENNVAFLRDINYIDRYADHSDSFTVLH